MREYVKMYVPLTEACAFFFVVLTTLFCQTDRAWPGRIYRRNERNYCLGFGGRGGLHTFPEPDCERIFAQKNVFHRRRLVPYFADFYPHTRHCRLGFGPERRLCQRPENPDCSRLVRFNRLYNLVLLRFANQFIDQIRFVGRLGFAFIFVPFYCLAFYFYGKINLICD